MESLSNILSESILSQDMKMDGEIILPELIKLDTMHIGPSSWESVYGLEVRNHTLYFRAHKKTDSSELFLNSKQCKFLSKFGITEIECPDPICWVLKEDSLIKNIKLEHPKSLVSFEKNTYTARKNLIKGFHITCGGIYIEAAKNCAAKDNIFHIIGQSQAKKYDPDDWSGCLRIDDMVDLNWENNQITTPQLDLIIGDGMSEYVDRHYRKYLYEIDPNTNTPELLRKLSMDPNCQGLKYIHYGDPYGQTIFCALENGKWVTGNDTKYKFI